MPLTPVDIYSKSFKKSLRGYDAQEVDDFLELVGAYYEEVISENQSLKDRVKELEEESEELVELENSIETKMNKADEVVENRREAAAEEAKSILNKAEQEATKIISDANSIRKKAKQETKNIIKEAELKGKEKIAKAREITEDKYREYQQLVENKRLFKIRFETLLKSHLEMLAEAEGEEKRRLKQQEEGQEAEDERE